MDRKGIRHFTWLNMYHQPMMEYMRELMDDEDFYIFNMLWSSYAISTQLKSAFFEVLRVSDGWRTLVVHKRPDESIKVQFTINPNYGNILERFTR